MTELSSQLKKKNHELLETSRKLSEVRESLDCTWSLLQKSAGGGGSPALLASLEAECSLSSLARAHLLLAVNDEAVQQRAERTESASVKSETTPASGGGGKRHRHSHHVANNDRQHWLLGSVEISSSSSS